MTETSRINSVERLESSIDHIVSFRIPFIRNNVDEVNRFVNRASIFEAESFIEYLIFVGSISRVSLDVININEQISWKNSTIDIIILNVANQILTSNLVTIPLFITYEWIILPDTFVSVILETLQTV